jgi:hypothetical protein
MDKVPLLFECIPYDTVTDNIDEAELSEQGNQEGSNLPAHFEPHGADKDSEKRQRAPPLKHASRLRVTRSRRRSTTQRSAARIR